MKNIFLIVALICAFITPAYVAIAADDDANANGPGYYRSTMPDGRVVFGSKPEKGATSSVFVPLRPQDQNIIKAEPTDPDARPRHKHENAGNDDTQKRAQALDAAAEELQQAQQELADAQAALANGQEPQEGERSGTATLSCVTHKDGTKTCTTVPSGSTQLNDDYYARQKQLQDAVDAAQQRVDEAQQRYNAARY